MFSDSLFFAVFAKDPMQHAAPEPSRADSQGTPWVAQCLLSQNKEATFFAFFSHYTEIFKLNNFLIPVAKIMPSPTRLSPFPTSKYRASYLAVSLNIYNTKFSPTNFRTFSDLFTTAGWHFQPVSKLKSARKTKTDDLEISPNGLLN